MSDPNEKSESQAKATKSKPRLKWLAWFKILILPLTLAGGGWWAQAVVTRNSLQKEYVSLSVGILAAKDVHTDLKKWAVELLDHTSPVPLPDKAKSALGSGVAMLPASAPTVPFDPPSAQMAFAPPPKESDDALKFKIRVLNSALKSIGEKESKSPVDRILVTELAGQRDKILRQKFESSYRIFLQYSANPNSLNKEQLNEIAPVIEWSKLEIDALK